MILFSELRPVEGLTGPLNLTDELYREYVTAGDVYHIDDPVALYFRPGGTTHRVVDSVGRTHCISFGSPSVVLRWMVRPGAHPVAF